MFTEENISFMLIIDIFALIIIITFKGVLIKGPKGKFLLKKKRKILMGPKITNKDMPPSTPFSMFYLCVVTVDMFS
jgi:hypothetical protein